MTTIRDRMQSGSASARREDWDRLNAIFQEALEKYPHSKFALHWLWNNAIATGPESFKPPPPPPGSQS